MRPTNVLMAFCLGLLLLLIAVPLQAYDRYIDWESFSVNLVKAIKSGHPGLQNSAMQHIIRYADYLDVNDAVYDIGLKMRFADDPNVQRLAMIALASIHSEKCVSYLCQYMKFLDDESARKQCCCILSEYYASSDPDKAEYYLALSGQ